MALMVFSSVRAALRAGMTTTTLASRLAVGMARQDTSTPFSRLRCRTPSVDHGVKAWQASLDVHRPVGFTRRPRPVLTPAQERAVAAAVRAAKAGDEDAVRVLYVRFADHVYGYVRSIVRDEHDAEDVTQAIFAKLIVAIHRYEPRAAPFSRWLLRLAHNAAVDHLRPQRSPPAAEVPGLHVAADDGDVQLRRMLQIALERIPADQGEVIVLRQIAGLTPGETAARL